MRRMFGGENNQNNENDDDDEEGGGGKAFRHLKYNYQVANRYFPFQKVEAWDHNKSDMTAADSTVASLCFSSDGVCDPDEVAMLEAVIETCKTDEKKIRLDPIKTEAEKATAVKKIALAELILSKHAMRHNRFAPFLNIHNGNFGIAEIRFRVASILAKSFQLENFIDTNATISFHTGPAGVALVAAVGATNNINGSTAFTHTEPPTFATPALYGSAFEQGKAKLKNMRLETSYALLKDLKLLGDELKAKSFADSHVGAVELFAMISHALSDFSGNVAATGPAAASGTDPQMDAIQAYATANELVTTDFDFLSSATGTKFKASSHNYIELSVINKENVTLTKFKHDIAVDWLNYKTARAYYDKQEETIEHKDIENPFLGEQARAFMKAMSPEHLSKFNADHKASFDTAAAISTPTGGKLVQIKTLPIFLHTAAHTVTDISKITPLFYDIIREHINGVQAHPNLLDATLAPERPMAVCGIRSNKVSVADLYDRCWERLYARIFRIDAYSSDVNYPTNMIIGGQDVFNRYHATHNLGTFALAGGTGTIKNTFKNIIKIPAARTTVEYDTNPPGAVATIFHSPAGFFKNDNVNQRNITDDDIEVHLLRRICHTSLEPKTARNMLEEFEKAYTKLHSIHRQVGTMNKVNKNEEWTDTTSPPFIRALPDVLLPLLYKVYTYVSSKQRVNPKELRNIKRTIRSLETKFKADIKRVGKSQKSGQTEAPDANILFPDEDIERVHKGELSYVNYRTVSKDEKTRNMLRDLLQFFSSGGSKTFMTSYMIEMKHYLTNISGGVQSNYLSLISNTVSIIQDTCKNEFMQYKQSFTRYMKVLNSLSYAKDKITWARGQSDMIGINVMKNYLKEIQQTPQLTDSIFKVNAEILKDRGIEALEKDVVRFEMEKTTITTIKAGIVSAMDQKMKGVLVFFYRKIGEMEKVTKNIGILLKSDKDMPPFDMMVFLLQIMYTFNEAYSVIKNELSKISKAISASSFGRVPKFDTKQIKDLDKYTTKTTDNAQYKRGNFMNT
jgi:hypothetical protein